MDQNVPPELLDLDLTSIDTSFPVIKGGMYDLVIKESDVVRNSKDDGDLWVLKLTPITDPQTIKGETLRASTVTLFHRVSLSPTENYTWDGIAKNVARVLQAVKPQVTGITTRDLVDGSFKLKSKAIAGRMIQAKIDALPERKDKKSGKTLQPGNEISQLVKAS